MGRPPVGTGEIGQQADKGLLACGILIALLVGTANVLAILERLKSPRRVFRGLGDA
jgi:hypothetical protein